MTALTEWTTRRSDPALTDDMLAHLDTQIASARRMLAIVLEQAGAIRRRAVRQVVTNAGQLQAEMHRRELIELERAALIDRAATLLQMAPESVGFSNVSALMDVESAQIADSRNAELRGLLVEIGREHELNRALMSQELSFLDHLLGLAGGAGGYLASGSPARRGYATTSGATGVRRATPLARKRVFDLEA